jgi:hypothetical protein
MILGGGDQLSFLQRNSGSAPYGENLLRPSMIIDYPYVLRNLYEDFHPHPTDGPVCGLVTNLKDDLDR